VYFFDFKGKSEACNEFLFGAQFTILLNKIVCFFVVSLSFFSLASCSKF